MPKDIDTLTIDDWFMDHSAVSLATGEPRQRNTTPYKYPDSLYFTKLEDHLELEQIDRLWYNLGKDLKVGDAEAELTKQVNLIEPDIKVYPYTDQDGDLSVGEFLLGPSNNI